MNDIICKDCEETTSQDLEEVLLAAEYHEPFWMKAIGILAGIIVAIAAGGGMLVVIYISFKHGGLI